LELWKFGSLGIVLGGKLWNFGSLEVWKIIQTRIWDPQREQKAKSLFFGLKERRHIHIFSDAKNTNLGVSPLLQSEI
jgi:hypothetical protein